MSYTDMKAGQWRRLSTEELMLLNCGAGEDLSPLDYKEIKPVNPKWNQPWIFTGRPDAEAAAPALWPPDVQSLLFGKDPDTGKDWGLVNIIDSMEWVWANFER